MRVGRLCDIIGRSVGMGQGSIALTREWKGAMRREGTLSEGGAVPKPHIEVDNIGFE